MTASPLTLALPTTRRLGSCAVVDPLARDRRRLRPQRHQPVLRHPAAARAATSRSPEVPADAPTRAGFAESQWVVDFHTPAAAAPASRWPTRRPAAWALTAEVGLDAEVRASCARWLGEQFAEAADLDRQGPAAVLVPAALAQLRRGARREPALRHDAAPPAAVVDCKQRWYGGWQGEVGRAAGWVNQTLYTERATRDAPRAFVRYEDLLDDWTRTVGRVAERLDLAVVRDAPAPAHPRRPRVRRPRAQPLAPGLGRHPRCPRRCGRRPTRSRRSGGPGRRRPGAAGRRSAWTPALRVRRLLRGGRGDRESSISPRAPRPARRARPNLPAPARKAIAIIPVRYKRKLPRRLRQGVVRGLARL